MQLRLSAVRIVVLSLSAACVAFAQTGGQNPAPDHVETKEELTARLTAAQRQQFDQALHDGGLHQYAEALPILKSLLKDMPGDPLLSKFAADSAVNVGDDVFARDALKPVVMANVEDWQAVVLLVRACAQAGDITCRNAAMVHLAMLHSHGITPAKMQEYVVERVKTATGSVLIYASLEPFSQYRIYNLGEISDSNGARLLTTTVESSDFDQPLFAKQHPKEAADGLRSFSLDGYRNTGMDSSGHPTQTHYTYGFLIGQPSYDTVRNAFLDIASGKTKPISSRDNLPTK